MAHPFLVADLFCGAGGSSTGAEKAVRALGAEMVLVCVNHWPVAIETHQKNHPSARHYVEDVSTVKPEHIVPEGYLDLLMASPECTHFSRARGGKPVNDQSRMNAWAINRWLTSLQVRCLLVENVREFLDWGPVDLKTGKPIRAQKGVYFQAWWRSLRELGYDVEWRLLNAADYGDATTRERLFLQARNDGQPIHWPEPTHSRPSTRRGASLFERRPRWRAAREVIDWSNPGRSLLDDPRYKKRPLSEKTRRRIARGVEKFGGPLAPYYVRLLGLEPEGTPAAEPPIPFMLPQRENNLPKPVTGPVPTIVTVSRIGLIEAKAEPFVGANRNNNVPKAADAPVPALTTLTGGGVYVVEPTAEPFVLGQGGGGVARSVVEPIPTVATDGAISLTTPLITKYNGKSIAAAIDEPLPTVTAKPRFGLVEPSAFVLSKHGDFNGEGGVPARSVEEPLPTITSSGHPYLVSPFIVGRHSSGTLRGPDEPLPTITGNGVGHLVEPFIVPKFGEAPHQEPRVHSLEDPLPTVTGDGAGRLVQPVVIEVAHTDTNGRVRSAEDPLSTITTRRQHGIAEPVVVKIDHAHQAGKGVRSVDEPMFTLTTKANQAVVEPILEQIREGQVDPCRVVLIDGVPHLLDIRFRMLTNRELARAMGFADHEAEYEFVGTVEQVTRQIGNAVPVNMAKALVTAVLDDRTPHIQHGEVA